MGAMAFKVYLPFKTTQRIDPVDGLEKNSAYRVAKPYKAGPNEDIFRLWL